MNIRLSKNTTFSRTLLNLIFVFIPFIALSQGFGHRQLLNDNWSFYPGDITYGGRVDLDHSEWRKLNLPHDWSVEGIASPQRASCTGYLPGGIGWYRKDLDIPVDMKGQQVYIYFEGVYNNSEVFINGKWLGKRPNGYISFMYDMTPFIKFGGKNVIAVRVDHSDEADSRWYTGSGIYRDVYLVFANPIHIDLWGVFFKADAGDKKAEITVETQLINKEFKPGSLTDLNVVQELIDAGGKVVASSSDRIKLADKGKAVQTFTLINPVLWSVENPALYTLQTTVKDHDRILDRSTTKVGIRKLSFDPDKGFALNGKPMKFKGVCIHHDAGCLGSAVPGEVWERRLAILKELGCNAIRTSHNPQAPDLYDLCDELGFLVMDEAFDEWEYPKKKWIEGWNVGTPGFQGSASYFREWGPRDLADMVRRDRNHPSVIMWSIGNEVDYPNDPYSHPILDEAGIGQQHTRGYLKSQPNAERLGEIARDLVGVVKINDTSRPVTAALAGAVMSNHTDYPFVLDVVGYNYTEDRYQMDHEAYPDRILYGSENRRDYDAWKAVTDNKFIMGQFLWTGFDYLGEAGPWPSRGFTTGLCNLAGYPKPEAMFRKSLWSEEPMTYVGTYVVRRRERGISTNAAPVWNYREKEMVRVVCYTNCQEAELLLNGSPAGERKPFDRETGIIYWDVPYEPGTLSVRSYNDGVLAASDSVETFGKPDRIIAHTDKTAFKEKGEVAHVEISIVDEQGRLVRFADPEVFIRTSGNLVLLGTENGSGNPADNYKDRVQRCLNGRLLLYIQAQEPGGESEVTISSPLYDDVIVSFR